MPERNKNGNWEKFIKANWNTLVAMDFKTVEVQCSNSLELETYYVLFAIKLSTREVKLCGITRYPKEDWMLLVGNSLTDPIDGFFLENKKCIIDNDVIFTKKFCNLLKDSKIDTVKTIIKAPNMNTFIERFIRTYKYEVLQWVIPSSVNHLRTITKEWLTHYNTERNHQGIDDHIIKPQDHVGRSNGEVLKISRLNGVLNYYYRASA